MSNATFIEKIALYKMAQVVVDTRTNFNYMTLNEARAILADSSYQVAINLWNNRH